MISITFHWQAHANYILHDSAHRRATIQPGMPSTALQTTFCRHGKLSCEDLVELGLLGSRAPQYLNEILGF